MQFFLAMNYWKAIKQKVRFKNSKNQMIEHENVFFELFEYSWSTNCSHAEFELIWKVFEQKTNAK